MSAKIMLSLRPKEETRMDNLFRIERMGLVNMEEAAVRWLLLPAVAQASVENVHHQQPVPQLKKKWNRESASRDGG